jgi:peroxiredoxin
MRKLFLLSAAVLMTAAFFRQDLHAQADQALIGQAAPTFELKNIDGKMVNLQEVVARNEGVILIFTCNHCPYSVKYEDRIMALDKKYKEMGYPVIAINPNDPVAYKEDNFANMKKRAKDKGFSFPYLVDETQEIAKAYAATRTPHVYIIRKEADEIGMVRYVGAIDDNTEAEAVGVKYVEDAIARLKAGEDAEPAYTKAIGCGIKWVKK